MRRLVPCPACDGGEILSERDLANTYLSWVERLDELYKAALALGAGDVSNNIADAIYAARGKCAMAYLGCDHGSFGSVEIDHSDPFDQCDDSSSDIHQVKPNYDAVFKEIGRAVRRGL